MNKKLLSLALIVLVTSFISCSTEAGPQNSQQAPAEADSLITTETGLKYAVQKEGTGETAQKDNIVSVHYTGWFENGQKFDSSRDRNEPFRFTLGHGEVIEGWDQGIAGMKVGEIRKLVIPPSLAYKEAGFPGAIPPNATLVFEVELLGVK